MKLRSLHLDVMLTGHWHIKRRTVAGSSPEGVRATVVQNWVSGLVLSRVHWRCHWSGGIWEEALWSLKGFYIDKKKQFLHYVHYYIYVKFTSVNLSGVWTPNPLVHGPVSTIKWHAMRKNPQKRQIEGAFRRRPTYVSLACSDAPIVNVAWILIPIPLCRTEAIYGSRSLTDTFSLTITNKHTSRHSGLVRMTVRTSKKIEPTVHASCRHIWHPWHWIYCSRGSLFAKGSRRI
jgi:hypothetical protein